MKNILINLRSSALISFLIVLPFMIMELVNRQSLRASGKEDFPSLLFVVMWFLPMIFLLIGMPIVRNLRRAGDSIIASPVTLLIRVAILIFIAWMWGSWLIDQLPCFLGVPLCD